VCDAIPASISISHVHVFLSRCACICVRCTAKLDARTQLSLIESAEMRCWLVDGKFRSVVGKRMEIFSARRISRRRPFRVCILLHESLAASLSIFDQRSCALLIPARRDATLRLCSSSCKAGVCLFKLSRIVSFVLFESAAA
jgi:hypothetical protein